MRVVWLLAGVIGTDSKVEMAEEGEDWELECYTEQYDDSVIAAPPCSNIICDDDTVLSGGVACYSPEPRSHLSQPRSDLVLVADWSTDASCCSSADVTSQTEHCHGDMGGDYVTDSKKVFVSNINYRVKVCLCTTGILTRAVELLC